MSTEDAGEATSAPESAAPSRRRGRPPKLVAHENIEATLQDVRGRRKARIRHDAPPAPIDGDYDPLRLTNEDPDYTYFWSSEKDLGRLQYRGWVNEQWSPACARPAFWFGAAKAGEPIRYRDLTLMRLPRTHAAALEQNDPARRRHAALMREVLRPTAPGHRMTMSQETLRMGVE